MYDIPAVLPDQPAAVESVPPVVESKDTSRHPAPDVVTIRDAARELRNRGFAVCRINVKEKRPIHVGWSRRSAEPEEFQPGEQLGIQTGWLSDGNRPGHMAVCIDVDAMTAIPRVGEFLPPTGMVDGRLGKPRSHHVYLVPEDTIPPEQTGTATADSDSNAAADAAGRHRGPRTRQFLGPDKKTIVEFRGSGGQAVVPPSVHDSGEVRVWEGGSPGEPAVISHPELMGRVEQLAEACGWVRPVPKQPREKTAGHPVAVNQPADIDPAMMLDATADTARSEAALSRGWEWYVEDYRGFLDTMIREHGLPRTSATGFGGGDKFTFELIAFGIVNLALPRRTVWDVFQEVVNFTLKSAADANGKIVDDSWSDANLIRIVEACEAKRVTSPDRGNRRLQPTPLDGRPTTPQFPAGLFPEWAESFISAQSNELQVPFDLVALSVLGAASAGIARKATVSPWAGWVEPTNLFIMCCLPPGERKSQSFAKVFAPVHDLERELRTKEDPIIKEKESGLRVAQKRVKTLEDKLAKATTAEQSAELAADLKTAQGEEQKIAVPTVTVLRVDDDTPEMVAKELVQQGGRLLIASPEARCIENISRYSDQPNFDVYLKGHAGDDIRSGRITRGRDAVERAALTCVITPQPSVLRDMGADPTLRDRGFVARWVYSLPMSGVGFRVVRPEPVPEGVRTTYGRMIQLLWGVNYADPEHQRPHELRFTPEAEAAFTEFERQREAMLRSGRRLSDMAGWGNKLGGLCIRFCGVLHVMDGIPNGSGWMTEPVPLSVVERAIRLCWEYILPHAEAAFGELGESPDTPLARRLLRWILNRKNPTADFTKRDAHYTFKKTVKKVEDLEPALRLLEEHRYIRRKRGEAVEKRPGPKSEVYEVHPAAGGAGS